MNKRENLDSVFNAKSVAIAGVSTGSSGQRFLNNLLSYGFKGKVYPLNPKGGEISGLKVYANIRDIPEPIDYVISCIPAVSAPQLIEDCAVKGVKAVSFYTAGFSEIGSEEGRELETEICRLAHNGIPRIIGPNCIGVYSPKAGLSFSASFPKDSGRVAFLCQSGGNTTSFVQAAAQRGVRFSKAVSYGNACDIDESDLLDYFTTDPETKIVAAYIEGVKDGQRFYRVLKELASKKPVIVLKGGYTEDGAGTAASHTGSLAGSGEVWEGVLQQTGAIRVYSLEELADMVVTFLYMSIPQGRRIGMFGAGGGASVLATDECAATGFSLPRLPEKIQEELRHLVTIEAGNILSNPLDLSSVSFDESFYNITKRLATYEEIDLVIAHVPLGIILPFALSADEVLDFLTDIIIKIHREVNKPIAMVIHYLVSNDHWQATLNAQRKCYEAGVPAYNSIAGAAKAIDRFLRYHENRSDKGNRLW